MLHEDIIFTLASFTSVLMYAAKYLFQVQLYES